MARTDSLTAPHLAPHIKIEVEPRKSERTLSSECVICSGATARSFAKRGYWIRECAECGHRSAEIGDASDHTQRVYGDKYFNGGEDGYNDYVSEGPIRRALGRWYGRRVARYAPKGTMLDVGSAAGFILHGFFESGWSGRGIEPNSSMATYAREMLGVPVDCTTLEQFDTTERYNLVSMIQVISHFADPAQALETAARITNPSGLLLIETWNRASWTARFFGKAWHEYNPPSVLEWFTPDGLARLAARFGFCEVARGRPPKRVSGAYIKSLLRYSLVESFPGKAAIRLLPLIPDRLVLPYPAEDLFWALYRKT